MKASGTLSGSMARIAIFQKVINTQPNPVGEIKDGTANKNKLVTKKSMGGMSS